MLRLVTCSFDKDGMIKRMFSSSVSKINEKDSSAVPLILAQGVIIAAVMCLCEFLCAPAIVSMTGGAFSLVPWAAIACLMAVAFTYILGFAFLWLADNLTHGHDHRLLPVVHGLVGMVSFAIWGGLVFTTVINSALQATTQPQLAGADNWIITANCGIVGLASFVIASIYAPRLSKSRGTCVVLGAIGLLLAALGGFYTWQLYAFIS